MSDSGSDYHDNVGIFYPVASSYNGNSGSTIIASSMYIWADPTWNFYVSQPNGSGGGTNSELIFPSFGAPNYMDDEVFVAYGTYYGNLFAGGSLGDPVLTLADFSGNGPGGYLADLATSSGAQFLSNGAGQPGWIYVQEQQQGSNVNVYLWNYSTGSLQFVYGSPQPSTANLSGHDYYEYWLPNNYICPIDSPGRSIDGWSYAVMSSSDYQWVTPMPSNTSYVDFFGPFGVGGCFGSTFGTYAGFGFTWYWFGGYLGF